MQKLLPVALKLFKLADEKIPTHPGALTRNKTGRLDDKYEFQGLPLSIELSKGSHRSGTGPDGHKWEILMTYDYGYIRGTEGVDGDHLDVYVGPFKDSQRVFVIHQLKPDTGEYDEDKVMLGFRTSKEAKAAYMRQYDTPTKFFGGIREIPMDAFKSMLKDHKGSSLTHGEDKDVHLKSSAVKPGPAPNPSDWSDTLIGKFTRKHPIADEGLHKARYNAKAHVLEVRTESGDKQWYHNVEPNQWKNFRRAKDKNQFLDKLPTPSQRINTVTGTAPGSTKVAGWLHDALMHIGINTPGIREFIRRRVKQKAARRLRQHMPQQYEQLKVDVQWAPKTASLRSYHSPLFPDGYWAIKLLMKEAVNLPKPPKIKTYNPSGASVPKMKPPKVTKPKAKSIEMKRIPKPKPKAGINVPNMAALEPVSTTTTQMLNEVAGKPKMSVAPPKVL